MGHTLTKAVQHDKGTDEASRKALLHFSKSEIKYLKASFKDLAKRSPGDTIDRKTFLQHFSLPGLHGEQLFNAFDYKQTGVLDFSEFITGLALCLRGTLEEKLDLIFKIYDISNNGFITRKELQTMLHQVPFGALSMLADRYHYLHTFSSAKDHSTLKTAPASDHFEEYSSLSASIGSHNHNNIIGSLPEQAGISNIWNAEKDNHEEKQQKQIKINLLLDDAFDKYDDDKDEKLSQDQFRSWVKETPEVIGFLESVFEFLCTPSESVPVNPSVSVSPIPTHSSRMIDRTNSTSSNLGTSLRQSSSVSASVSFPSLIEVAKTYTEPPLNTDSQRCLGIAHSFSMDDNGVESVSMSAGKKSGLWKVINKTTQRMRLRSNSNTQQNEQEFFEQTRNFDPKGCYGSYQSSHLLNEQRASSHDNLIGQGSLDATTEFFPSVDIERSKTFRSYMSSSPISYNNLEDQSKVTNVNVKEGNLTKFGKRSNFPVSRHYVLHGNVMCYFNNKKDHVPRGVILLSGSFVDPIPPTEHHSIIGNLFGFVIKQTYNDSLQGHPDADEDEIIGEIKLLRRVFYAKTQNDCADWVNKLRIASKDRKFSQLYILEGQIGSGKFATVHKCREIATNNLYAVKILEKETMSLKEKELLRTEIAILRLVEHPNIVKFYDVFEDEQKIYLLSELIPAGELFETIVGRSRFTELEAYVLLKQLVLGVQYLHSAGIMHRDIKPENVLLNWDSPTAQHNRTLNTNTVVKLTDFGLSKLVFPDQLLDMPCGTISYVAPEVLAQKGYNVKADLWSIGIIMYLVLGGRLPFDAEQSEDIKMLILGYEAEDGKAALFGSHLWSKFSPGLVDIISKLIHDDPDKRLSCEQVLDHEWMTTMSIKHPLGNQLKSQLSIDTQ